MENGIVILIVFMVLCVAFPPTQYIVVMGFIAWGIVAYIRKGKYRKFYEEVIGYLQKNYPDFSYVEIGLEDIKIKDINKMFCGCYNYESHHIASVSEKTRAQLASKIASYFHGKKYVADTIDHPGYSTIINGTETITGDRAGETIWGVAANAGLRKMLAEEAKEKARRKKMRHL